MFAIDNGIGAGLAVEDDFGQSFEADSFVVFPAVAMVGKYGGLGKIGDRIQCFLFTNSVLTDIALREVFHC